ncbi:3-oxoacyl-ACP synthase III family protein [Nocardiopsis sp. YSL2]|uniref:3-oxoacyl-ACP synthase III family protein n=1 Tax=Nocardiopsis sp. YSL2 TaxID=2939492 RepID=UPI0026F41D4C|nr:ketoacyl-ACP synthase III [Nocardiopsis sp. YSL2]
MTVVISGVGGYLPREEVSNARVAERAGVSTEWIGERTGVRTRRRAAADEATSDLAARAAEKALASAGLRTEEVGLIVSATSLPDELGPSVACRIQGHLGAANAVAMDVGAACSGFLYALEVARCWLHTRPDALPALVVGAEVYSRFVDPADRATACLFADGAGAVVLTAGGTEEGLAPIRLGADGRGADLVGVFSGGTRRPASMETVGSGEHTIRMDGRAISEFTLRQFPRMVRECLEDNGLSLEDIALVVSHQPNPLLLVQAGEQAGIPPEKIHITGDRVGNIGAGSVPFGLAHAEATGRLHRGDRVLLLAFGAGMTWGCGLLTWTGTTQGQHSDDPEGDLS